MHLYSPKQIRTATVLGTWVAGWWMLAANYRAAGDSAKALRQLLAAVVSTGLMFVGGPLLSGCFALVLALPAETAGLAVEEATWLFPIILGFGPAVLWTGLWFAVSSEADNFAERLENADSAPSPAPRSTARVAAVCVVSLTAVPLAGWAFFSVPVNAYRAMM